MKEIISVITRLCENRDVLVKKSIKRKEVETLTGVKGDQ